ncbi:MAG: TGS domain-containing protein [Candidatus Aminicenantes bacterium]|nr:TGS domain-containing protein [Candidatus Aminicenantes bacterium]
MPANLPPQYFETEKKLKTAKTPQEKILILEELLSIVPKHKGTEKLQALLKTKISKLKSSAQKKASTARRSPIHLVEKSGAGQVVLVGPPNSGKSSLVKILTNANPEIGDYPFTTRQAYPAMMKYENIQIQLVDTPPITLDYMETWLPELIKGADGVLLILDLAESALFDSLMAVMMQLEEKRIKLVIVNKNIPEENRLFYKKALIVANKKDLVSKEKIDHLLKELSREKLETITISSLDQEALGELRKKIFFMLDIIRIYSKAPGKKATFDDPFTLKKGSTVSDFARTVHQDFAQKMKYARIWSEKKYQGQMVNRDHVLEDEDIIELHI